MLNINEVPKAWLDFKQLESGVEKYPTLIRFRILGTTYYGAVDKTGKQLIRRAPLTLKSLTGCSAAKIKELQK